MKDLLVVAYAFPPCSVTGTHRPLAFVKYLDALGWRSTVLCAKDGIYPGNDERLLAEIPASAKVIRLPDVDLLRRIQELKRQRSIPTKALATRPTISGNQNGPWRRFKRSVALLLRPPGRVPGWYRPTLRAGRAVIHKREGGREISAIYSSGPPWTVHLVARQLHLESGLPWIADFRDPWVANPMAEEISEQQRRQDALDEATVLAHADIVLVVLETMREDFLRRYPSRTPEDVLTILNGFDPELFAQVAAHPRSTAESAENLTLLHAGHLYGRRRIEPLLTGLQIYWGSHPTEVTSLQLKLLGGTPAYVSELRRTVEQAGAAEWVTVEAAIPHAQALQRMAAATVLVLVGFTGPGEGFQMTGKIFEYLALRRPILALAPPTSPVGDVLRAAGVRHWIIPPDDVPGIVGALRAIAAAWRSGELNGPQGNASLAAYDRREQATQLARLLDTVTDSQPAERQTNLSLSDG